MLYPGSSVDHIEVTNGTSEANYLIALTLLRQGDRVAMEVPNYMQMPGVAALAPRLPFDSTTKAPWEPDWDQFEQAVAPETRRASLEPEQSNRRGAAGSGDAANRRALRTNGNLDTGR